MCASLQPAICEQYHGSPAMTPAARIVAEFAISYWTAIAPPALMPVVVTVLVLIVGALAAMPARTHARAHHRTIFAIAPGSSLQGHP